MESRGEEEVSLSEEFDVVLFVVLMAVNVDGRRRQGSENLTVFIGGESDTESGDISRMMMAFGVACLKR